MSDSSSSVQFRFRTPGANRSWLPYFLAAFSAGAAVADEELLRYYWLMPEDTPEKATQVIRVLGEKGERYEEVYADDTLAELKQHPAIMEARIARQAALRKEAVELARQLREEGKEPLAAYEEAWTLVFSRNWLNAGSLQGSCKLEDMLTRLASENADQELTEGEKQWLLEALLEDDDRLESEAGLQLLRRLAAQLRQKGYGLSAPSQGRNDELMQHFAAALEHQSDSMAAFREAMFQTHRGQIMTHTLVGYRAPWGMGAGGGVHYHQAPLQVQATEGSGNTQPTAQLPLTQGNKEIFVASGLKDSSVDVTDFLATAPPMLAEKEEDEEEKEKQDDDDVLADSESESAAAAPAMMMMRSFSMRSAAYAVQNEGEADAPESPDSPVHGGVVELAQDEILDVGANRVMGGSLAGGSLENVQMVVTGEIFRPVTKDYVTVHNLVSSADGTNPGIMRDVTLYAGTSTEYATLHNIAFAGQSELTGYVTFEKTQTTGDIYVAAGGTLTLNNLTFDLRGLAMEDEKTLIDVKKYGGTLKGWAKENVHFVYSGVKVNNAAVVIMGDGAIKLSADHEGKLYWNGAADKMWNIGSVNWSSSAEKTVPETFTALSNVYFGGGNAANREITVTQDMVVAKLGVTDGGYSFSGARVAVLGNATFEHKEGAVTFNNQLVVQGGLQAKEGSGSVALLGGATIVEAAVFENLTTTIAGDMTVGGKLTVKAGDASTAGTLTITGNVTAQEMELAVSAGSGSSDLLVDVSGNLSVGAGGSVTIGGSAKQQYTGTVTAGNLIVNTQRNDVYFSRLQVDKLTVGEGATVHVQTSSDSVTVSSSKFPVIDLTGTLVLDAPGVTYNDRHSVYVKSDAAKLKFDSGCTVEDLQIFGMADNSGDFNYTDLAIEVTNSSSATVTKMQDLGTLEVTSGSLTVKDATGAVHGKLILDKAKLKLGAGADDIMATGSDESIADGSGAVELKNGARLDIGSTTQTLSAGNAISLSGASSITGAADGGGLKLRDDSLCVNYENTGNSIDANLTVAAGQTITLNSASANSSLEISGSISGSGDIVLGNSDSETENVPGTVVLYGANTGFKGKVTVYDGSTLTLLNTEALSNASGVVLEFGGTLALNAPGAVNLNALTFKSGSSLSISSIVGTDAASSKDAVLNVNDNSLKLDNVVLNLNFSQELQSMQTYNIMTGVSSIDNLSFNVTHNNDVKLDVSQYKIVLDGNLLYIHTMMGNVWDGSYSENWTLTGNGGNWSGDEYQQGEGVKYTAAIFGDLTTDGQTQSTETVKVKDVVSPGNVYFTADTTAYQLDSDGGGLAAGTRIHKLGKADVTLGLANNATEGTALGNVDIQAGSLTLSNKLAVKGTVEVDDSATLTLKSDTGGLDMVGVNGVTYTASSNAGDAKLSGVTMDAAGIRGTKDVYNAAIEDDIKAAEINASNLLVQGNAELQYLILEDFKAAGNVTLSDVTLTSSSTATTLTGVTIGSGVEVNESGSYILTGNITFDATLNNSGKVTLSGISNIELGKITPEIDTNGKYIYTFIDGGEYEFISSSGEGESNSNPISSALVSINGVNLGTGIKVEFTDNENGSFTLSFAGNTVGIPQWDERWGKTKNAPAFSRRYESTATDTFTQASGIGGDAKYVSLGWGIVVDATKQSHDATYFKYGSIVNETNAKRVNDGKAIVVTLTSDAKGDLVVGGNIAESEAAAADHEVWIYDSSGVRTIIGGLTNNKIDPGTSDSPGSSVTTPQTAATHILVDSKVTNDKIHVDGIPETDYAKEYIIGGSRWCNQDAESFVTVKSGHIYNIFGGSCGGWHGQLVYDNYGYVTKRLWGFENGYVDWTVWVYDETLWRNVPYLTQTGTAHVYVDGGTVGEIFAGGFYANIIGTQKVEGKERPRAVEMVLTGGTIGGPDLRVFGGTDHGVVTGDIYVRMEGSANVTSILVGGSNAGVVKGDVVLDLISGTANKVEAPGKGWDEGNDLAQIYGDVLVNLYSGFKLGKGIIEYNNPNVDDLECGIFGGMEKSNHVKILKENAKSTLHFAEGGATYTLGAVNSDGYTDSANSSIVTGFDAFSLEDKAHVVLALGKFDVDMDPSKTLAISGKGVVEVIGRGSNFGRNIELQKSATLKISTCDIGTGGIGDVRTITVTDGTTVDFTGFSITGLDPATPGKAGLDFNVKICGNGVDGKGALYMGQSTQTADDTNAKVNEIYLPKVELTGSASVKVVAQEALYMDSIKLAGNTLTKLGAGDFITRSVEKVDEKTTGTILVQQGTFGVTKTTDAAATDMVLAAGAKLKLNATDQETTDQETTDTADLTLRSLSGAGTVELNGSTLTLQTVEDSAYYTEYMPVEYTGGSTSYDQFLGTTGFGYAVFSGLIKDDGKLVKDGKGVHYILGSSNTYTGGTELKKGRLYLLGTSTSEDFTKGASSVSSSVAGTGDIEWTGSAAELYLGHGAHIYNNGTVSGEGAVITIGVEGALKGVLADFCKGTTTVTKGEDTYVVIDTHNLKSIAVDALYADGTAYTAGTEIDRSKMLLVKDSSVNATAVTFLSANGYNEATYSGMLSGDGVLHKVGAGTLDLDQTNSYTGGTQVKKGTLRLRGWGTVGSGAVQVNAGSSLMLTYIGGYGEDETKSLANDIYLYGNGDEQWKAHDSTSKQTAALISTLGQAVEFTLSGNIHGNGGVLHSGAGTLVLNGDSTYTGGTVITRGVVEVQSATGLGATADGQSAVNLKADADLYVTVENGTTGEQLVTTFATVGDDITVGDEILGDVNIVGTESTERILHMADNGYSAATTTLGENGTLLLRGAPIEEKGLQSTSDLLTGKGSVVVSDPTGKGATASFGTITDYTGDFRVEGDKASIQVNNGSYSGGSIAVSGQQASVQIGGNVSIEAGESLQLSSTGFVPDQKDGVDMGTGAVLVSHGMVSVAAGAELSASKAETVYAYDDISELEKAASVTVSEVVLADEEKINAYHKLELGADDPGYDGWFDADIAINQQAVAGVKADVGLTLAGGSTYRTDSGHISLMGGSLTLDTLADNQLTFNTVLDVPYETLYGKVQLVLFSEVSSVKFIYGDITKTTEEPGVYYTSADYFLTGCDYIDSQTMLVYDSHAGVVYLEMKVPEPATTALGLVALAALAARRRRKRD